MRAWTIIAVAIILPLSGYLYHSVPWEDARYLGTNLENLDKDQYLKAVDAYREKQLGQNPIIINAAR